MNITEKYSTLVFFFLMYIYEHDCMKVIPERAKIMYVNENFITNASISVRRYSRRTDYVGNLKFTSKVEMGNNVTVHVIFYQYLHNEFRRSFVELHYKLCDFILEDPYFGSVLRKNSLVTCPVSPGIQSFTNVSLDVDIPSVWPFEKGKAEVFASDVSETIIGKLEIVLTFKQKLPMFKNKN